MQPALDIVPAVPSPAGDGSRSAIPILVCALVVVFLALSPSAWAARSSARKRPGTSAEFTVAGTNGYRLYVKSEGGQVRVVVAKKPPAVETFSANGHIRRASTGNLTFTAYTAFGSPTDPRTIEADLGSLGKVSVTFQPSGETHVSTVDLKDKTEHCVGAERIVRRLGTFNGSIEFQGEDGYTAVDASSVKGTVGTSLFRNCTTQVAHRSNPARRSRHLRFTAIASGSSLVLFSASADRPCVSGASAACFYGDVLEARSPDLLVGRSARAFSDKHRITFNDALTVARFNPPPPFFGQGSFRIDAQGTPSWTGSLSVAFPGATIPLTGPAFEAKISR
jgi:hypothetical protein